MPRKRKFSKSTVLAGKGSIDRTTRPPSILHTPITQMRAMWSEGVYWNTKQEALTFLEACTNGGFNTVIANVWHGYGVNWNTTYDGLQWDSRYTQPSFDPSAHLIAEAHNRNVTVYAWFTCGSQGHAIHDAWRENGGTFAANGAGHFDFTNVSFVSWLTGLIVDFVTKNPTIDGIVLDYIRFSNSPTGPLYGNQAARVAVISSAIQAIKTAIRAIHPTIRLSCWGQAHQGTPIGKTWRDMGNDMTQWVHEGLIDIGWDGLYEDDPSTAFQAYEGMLQSIAHGDRLYPVVANYTTGIVARTPANLAQVLGKAQLAVPAAAGLGVYVYNPTLYTAAHADYLRQGLFRSPARVSPLLST